jgi:hypothetical protein
LSWRRACPHPGLPPDGPRTSGGAALLRRIIAGIPTNIRRGGVTGRSGRPVVRPGMGGGPSSRLLHKAHRCKMTPPNNTNAKRNIKSYSRGGKRSPDRNPWAESSRNQVSLLMFVYVKKRFQEQLWRGHRGMGANVHTGLAKRNQCTTKKSPIVS